jgi:NADPH:quinone reductase
MYKVVVKAFGGSEQLEVVELPDPIASTDSNQVVVRLTSIGLNHADLMARRGEYRLISGNPPFTPGLEGGGYIESVGANVNDRFVGQRVILSPDAPQLTRRSEGTYQSHYLTVANKTVPVPDAIPDELLGAIWLPYLTAWGCLIWKQCLKPNQIVLLPAASSSVAIAASQVVKHYGATSIGATTSASKLEKLKFMPEASYNHLVLTGDLEWPKEVRKITNGKGPSIIFDPVAAGQFLNAEISLLANEGTIWIYGLLGKVDMVDVTPLIRKRAAIRGWVLNELSLAEPEDIQLAYKHVLDSIASGIYQLPIAKFFPLKEASQAHEEMEKGEHIGKFILIP